MSADGKLIGHPSKQQKKADHFGIPDSQLELATPLAVEPLSPSLSRTQTMAFPVLTADLAMYFLKLLLERLQRGRAWWLGAPSIFCAGAAVGAVGAAVNAGAVAVVAAILG